MTFVASDHGIIVRPPRPDEPRKLITLINRLALEAEYMVITPLDADGAVPLVAEYIAGRIGSTEEAVFVADDGQDLIGLMTLNPVSAQAARRGVIDLDIGIAAGWQRRGIGRRLLAEAEAWALRHAVHRLQLLVITENAPAIALYHAAGFEREGLLRECVTLRGRRYDQFLMAKLLGH